MMAHLQPLTSPAFRLALTKVRLIATDMDGTLTQDERFSPPLLTALAQLAATQIPVVITTGRSAGWVGAIAHYLPVAGAMAENGGVYYFGDDLYPHWVEAQDSVLHRQGLRSQFERLRQTYPNLREAADNAFRLTDWTYSVEGLNKSDLNWMAACCQDNGFDFTYSTVQCHILPKGQNKAAGLNRVLQTCYAEISPEQVLTVGDSPNDESLFDSRIFPHSVGVANVKNYLKQLRYHPAFVTQSAEIAGFLELTGMLLGELS